MVARLHEAIGSVCCFGVGQCYRGGGFALFRPVSVCDQAFADPVSGMIKSE